MSSTARIFDQIRQSEMNGWVGGLDPEAIGDACVGILDRYVAINPHSRLLDFGCGVGRVSVSVLKRNPTVGHITGFDILPQVIAFCDAHIASAFPQTRFELIQGSNEHYDRYIAMAGASSAKNHALIQSEHAAAFTAAYAFSVFTHVEIADYRSLLKLLSNLLQPGGTLLFTAFLLTPFSRQAIQEANTWFSFTDPATEAQGNVFIGNAADRLSFIAFDLALVQQMVFEAGLVVTHVEHGSWAGGNVYFSPSVQDVVVCRRPVKHTGPVRQAEAVTRPPRVNSSSTNK
jgi:cyclopropane fatty-acyl-phospholipid synthase-like methyltransferase